MKNFSGVIFWRPLKLTSDVIMVNIIQPRSQGLSSLPPLVVGRKTLVAAGHVTACDTNFSTGVESTNSSEKMVIADCTFEIFQFYCKLHTGQTIFIYLYPAY